MATATVLDDQSCHARSYLALVLFEQVTTSLHANKQFKNQSFGGLGYHYCAADYREHSSFRHSFVNNNQPFASAMFTSNRTFVRIFYPMRN